MHTNMNRKMCSISAAWWGPEEQNGDEAYTNYKTMETVQYGPVGRSVGRADARMLRHGLEYLVMPSNARALFGVLSFRVEVTQKLGLRREH